jgi:hypothetical protein
MSAGENLLAPSSACYVMLTVALFSPGSCQKVKICLLLFSLLSCAHSGSFFPGSCQWVRIRWLPLLLVVSCLQWLFLP